MKYVEEFRNAEDCARLSQAIAQRVTRPMAIMEVCGGQTHAIVRHRIDTMVPADLTFIHGPGCPVCVTAAETLDRAIALAQRPGLIMTAFGDMLRVPGSDRRDLMSARAAGGEVKIVYSPLDALKVARANPDKEVVFFAVGFETTAPSTAIAVWQARQTGLRNFSLLVAHVRVPPALEALCSAEDCRVDAFLAAGHVCAVMGWEEYEPIAAKYHRPIVVTGFEPTDILQGVLAAVTQLDAGRAEVENRYARAVSREGNTAARGMMNQVYQVVDRPWRGLGVIPGGGLGLREEFAEFDAERRFDIPLAPAVECAECQAGLVLKGILRPPNCPAFGTLCTPEHPLGATMVSAEGACAAYYQYARTPRQPKE